MSPQSSSGSRMPKRAILVIIMGLMGLAVGGCASEGESRGGPRSETYQDRHPGSQRPYYREYGPWDLPNQAARPGPPTWYGCPQQSRACYSD